MSAHQVLRGSAPSRLIEELETPEDLALLRAGIEDVPPDGMLDRALLKAGLGAGAVAGAAMTSGSATSTAVAAGAASGWLGSMWAKVAIGVGVLAAANIARVTLHTSDTSGGAPKPALIAPAIGSASASATATMPTMASTPELPAEPVEPVETPIASASAAPSAAPQEAVARPLVSAVVPETVESISLQTAAIDGARRAIDRGDAGGALAALDRYDHDFPRGAFGQEATALRIQALLRRGDRAAANALGRRFLLAHPRSPLAKRIESMLHPGGDPR